MNKHWWRLLSMGLCPSRYHAMAEQGLDFTSVKTVPFGGVHKFSKDIKIKTIMPIDQVCYRNSTHWSHLTFTFFSLNQLLTQLSKKSEIPLSVSFSQRSLRIHWRVSTILKTSNKVYEVVPFWCVKIGTFWKCIQYTIFLSLAPNHHSFTFNLRFSYELKHKVCLSKTVFGIFNFRFRFVFVKVYIFVQQNVWTVWL